jgi:hypothetical protein
MRETALLSSPPGPRYGGAASSVRNLVAMACCVLLLGGCSMVRLGYGQLDTLAEWRVARYFDLDPHQKAEFRKRFSRLHEWHRHEQLPDYAAFLAQAGARLERDITREDVVWFVEGVKTRYRTLVMRASDDAAALLMSITPAQLKVLQHQWDEDDRRFAREYGLDGDPGEIADARAHRTLERVRNWAGSLSHEQEQRITALAGAAPAIERLRREDRLRRKREFLQLMAGRDNGREFPARLRAWLLDWENGRSPEYEQRLEGWFDHQAKMIVEITGMLTPRQRARVAGRLRRYAEDFTHLADRPRTQTAAQ